MIDTFGNLVTALARHLGLQEPEGIDRAWELTIDGISLVLEADRDELGDGVLLRAGLGVVPDDGRAEIQCAVLEGNLLWSGTGGATIGVNSATGEAVIALYRPLEALDGERAARLCLAFADTAAQWRNLFATGLTPPPQDLPGAPFDPGLMRV